MVLNKLLPRIPVLFTALSIALAPHLTSAETLWAFGDSLVDNGNTPRITGVAFPPAPLYVGFRFSNGPTFAEYLPHLLDLNSTVGTRYGTGTNFGVGGALSGDGNNTPRLGPLLPGLAQEIDLFQAQGEHFGSRDVVAVWAGANDYFDLLASPTPPTQQQATVTVIQDTTNLTTAAQRLINLGARQLVFVNLPDLGKLPLINSITNPVQRAIAAAAATQLTNSHDQLLEQDLARVHAQTGVNIFLFNADLAFNQVLANPAKYGFSNVKDAANANPALLFAPTAVQNTYLFWDGVHPTTAGHLLVAEDIANMVVAPTTLASQTQLMTYGARAFADLMYTLLGPVPVGEIMPPAAPTEGKGELSSPKVPVPPPKNVISTGPENRWSVFVLGDYRQGSRDDRFNSVGFDYYLGDVAVGASYTFSPLITAGLLFGYGYNKADLNDGQGHVDVDAYQVGGFLDFHGPNWYVGGIAAYGYDNYDQRRPGVLGDSIKGEPNGQTVVLGLQGGYFWQLGRFSVGPVGSLTFTSVNVEGYSESGNPVLTQEVHRRTVEDLFGTIGLRASCHIKISGIALQPYVKGEFEHEILGDGKTIKTQFTSEPALEIDTPVEDSSQDYGRLGIGVAAKFTDRISGQVGFDALVGRSDGQEYTVNGGISFSF